ncbi:unnamed protein product [Thlaspi arvense]|uniref:EDRF1 N-terminal domain-containing protein n=1 Tax=Thlaspi arvense TaxID=13288 RepID=A0AAU9R7C3_THLAR|nr:unnamed protein product [Thlaspi arvense]
MLLPYLSSTIESSRELQCVRTMEIVVHKPVDFLCGSIPVLADSSFPTFTSALLPSQETTVIVSRYQMIPIETDLTQPPLLTDFPEKVLPLAAVKTRITGGISKDGTPAFHPHVVQQNGLAVLRFLQSNCKEDPGAYWLYKSAGEDVIQLFDLSMISKKHSSSDHNDSARPLPSLIHSGRSDSLFSLGNLLYRVRHRLSLSVDQVCKVPRKCLNFLDEPDHLVVRAYAHEQFARLILNNDEEVDLTFESNNVQREVKITDLEEESLELVSPGQESSDSPDPHNTVSAAVNSSSDSSFDLGPVCQAQAQAPVPLLQAGTRPISSKLAAIHHVSQVIKSLRCTRQLQSSEDEGSFNDILPSVDFSKCTCGHLDCIEVCDIRKWLPISKLDRKLWNLVLLLGESYLSLGEAYKEDGQLHQDLNTVELACSIYGSMPQKYDETLFVSSINKSDSMQPKSCATTTQVENLEAKLDIGFRELSSTLLFWAKGWMLVGDIHVQFHILKGQEFSKKPKGTSTNQLRMPSEVVKEVQRLKKKLTEYSKNCASCSLVNCSCKSDRASSGSSASSSSSNGSSARIVPHSRKNSKKSQSKNATNRLSRNVEDDPVNLTVENITHKEEDTSVGTKEAVTEEELWDEEMVQKMEALKLHPAFKNEYKQALGTGKQEYSKSLKYYMAAKTELIVATAEASSVPDDLKVEVYKQLAHTYLRFGMHLGKYDTTSAGHGHKSIVENIHASSSNEKKDEVLSASDAIRVALALYESLEELRKQEAAFAYLQLARYHKDCCLRFLETERQGRSPSSKPETNVVQRAKQTEYTELYARFWAQLQMVLKRMLALSLPAEGANKSQTSGRSGDSGKLRELYKTSLKSTSLSDLNAMHVLWTSSS